MADSRPKRVVPFGLLGTIAIVAIVECGISRQVDRFTTTTALAWRLGAESARRDAPGREVLFFGDSLIKHGLLPRVFERVSGKTAFNLAQPSSPAATSYFLLRRTLAAGARPSAIVVDFKPSLLAAKPDRNWRQWSELLELRELCELAWAARDVSLVPEVALAMALPSLRKRFEIRDAVSHAVRGESDPLTATNRTLRRNWSENDGANVATINPKFTGDVEPRVIAHLASNRWSSRPVNAAFVERFLKLAESHRIPVYWLLPPSCPELERRRDLAGDEAKFRAYVRSVQTRHPTVTIFDARDPGWDNRVFVDSTHLDVRGAVALTRAVAEAIHGPRSSWVAIRRGPDSGPLPETVDESRVALERSGSIVR